MQSSVWSLLSIEVTKLYLTTFLVHRVLLSSSAFWTAPSTSGQAPPPCAGMTFNRVDLTRVITIGGDQPGVGIVNKVHILDTDYWVCELTHQLFSLPEQL